MLKIFINDFEKSESKIDFISVDVDFFSTSECLNIFFK